MSMDLINVNEMYFDKRVNLSPFFHYTSAEALKSIIENSSIRFTHCAFLNDTEEYLYIDEVMGEVVTEEKDPEVSSFIKKMQENLDKTYSGLILKPVDKDKKWLLPSLGEYYVLSGTSERDSLPMWNYYVKSGDYFGYAISLDIRKLYKLICPFLPVAGEFLCGKIVYDRETQKSIIYDFTKKLLADYNKLDETERNDIMIDDLQNSFYDFIQRTRLFFKREGFMHEKELRAVVLTNTEPKGTEFSKGYTITKGIIKPYIEYSFSEETLPIKQVVLSPTIEEIIGKRGIEMLLREHNYVGVSVDKSELKLRY